MYIVCVHSKKGSFGKLGQVGLSNCSLKSVLKPIKILKMTVNLVKSYHRNHKKDGFFGQEGNVALFEFQLFTKF